jgi:murein DD-endopeptidase MepM/ murein hydrolase activator NlpD
LPVRGRPRLGRPPILASSLAALLALAASGSVLAGTTSAPVTPEARVQRPGEISGYRLPFAPGLEIPIEQGWNSAYSHNGRSAYAYDFGLQLNTPVLAAASGVVSYVHSGEAKCGGADLLKHANYVTIDHPDGSATQYGHLGEVEVKVGQSVQVGQEIGLSGRTGFTGCMPHLHFARQVQGGPVTQSIPVYFEEYPNDQFVDGEMIETTPACGAKGAPIGTFCATYRSPGAKAPELFTRVEKTIDFDWRKHSPGGYWLDDATAGFEVTWSGTLKIESAGVYLLDVRASDHVRMDGVALVDSWSANPRTHTHEAAWRATPGKHTIVVEHLDLTGKGQLHVALAALQGGAWVHWAEVLPDA